MMLEANEINPNVSEDKLTMDASDEDEDSKVNKTSDGEKILKGLTMEVSCGLPRFQWDQQFRFLQIHTNSHELS